MFSCTEDTGIFYIGFDSCRWIYTNFAYASQRNQHAISWIYGQTHTAQHFYAQLVCKRNDSKSGQTYPCELFLRLLNEINFGRL